MDPGKNSKLDINNVLENHILKDNKKSRWDKRYQHINGKITAAKVLSENLHLLPKCGDSLDLACGRGGNALMLAKAGLRSQAWDISETALHILREAADKQRLKIITHQQDIEKTPPEKGSFDVIVVSYFLNREICTDLVKALRPNGLLFYQTFCREKMSENGPNKSEFLLERNELLSLFDNLKVLYYREDNRCGNLHLGHRDTAQFIGQKTS
tara:strand:+ start:2122 stop:2757 length:636 start_codon:yes stop_codon:yes gene_type:complete